MHEFLCISQILRLRFFPEIGTETQKTEQLLNREIRIKFRISYDTMYNWFQLVGWFWVSWLHYANEQMASVQLLL